MDTKHEEINIVIRKERETWNCAIKTIYINYLHSYCTTHRGVMFVYCSSTMTKEHFLVIFYGTKWPLCADVL